MTKKYVLIAFLAILFILFYSCTNDQDDNNNYTQVSPVTLDLTQVPYAKLSDYNFFQGPIKDLNPVYGVLPYEPASSLFADYAHKKRFVWMPSNTIATYNGDNNILELPVGAVLIKNFYYEDVVPSNTTQIIETRIMIKKSNGWIFANYVWNDDQTEAFFDLDGSFKSISWNQNGTVKNVNYRIPNEVQCITCHKTETVVNGNLVTTNTPIGIKPQNLNFNYNYADGSKNQLMKWIEKNYLTNNFSLPTAQNTVINYEDDSQPLENRTRAYFDINCAHCHTEGGHCSYRPLRLSYNETFNNRTNMGVCVDTEDMQDFPPALSKLVTPGNIGRSMLYYRLDTEDESYRMPLHGRTLIHTEGVELVEDWINSLSPCQ